MSGAPDKFRVDVLSTLLKLEDLQKSISYSIAKLPAPYRKTLEPLVDELKATTRGLEFSLGRLDRIDINLPADMPPVTQGGTTWQERARRKVEELEAQRDAARKARLAKSPEGA